MSRTGVQIASDIVFADGGGEKKVVLKARVQFALDIAEDRGRAEEGFQERGSNARILPRVEERIRRMSRAWVQTPLTLPRIKERKMVI